MESKGDRSGNDDADECDFQLVVQDFLPVVAEDGSCVYEENRPGTVPRIVRPMNSGIGNWAIPAGREMNVRTPGRRRLRKWRFRRIFQTSLWQQSFSCSKAAFGRMFQYESASAFVAHVVGSDGTSNAGSRPDGNGRPERENFLRNKKTGKAQNDFTGNRNIHVFKSHTDEESEVSPVIEEVDDDVHRSPLCINDAAGRKQKYLEESPA